MEMVATAALGGSEAMETEAAVVAELTGSILPATAAAGGLAEQNDWLTQNAPMLAEQLNLTADGMDAVNASAMPAASSVESAASAAGNATGQFTTAAQQAAALDAILAGMAGRTVNIDFHFNVPDLPALGGQPQTPQAMASGYEGWINRPTLAMIGERGPEYVSVTPRERMGNTNNNFGGDTIIVNSGAQAAMIMSRKARTRALGRTF
jgi:hypothetical protein